MATQKPQAGEVFSFLQTSIPTGVFQIPPTSIGASFISLILSLARCTTATPAIWPNASTTLVLELEVSYDGGVTWQGGGGVGDSDGNGWEGGIELNKDGSERTASVATFTYPQTPTHLRGTLTIAGGPLVTSGNVTVS